MDQKAATKDIIIIAGGPSVGTMPCHELVNYGHVIGVNESSVLLPCHEAISMDRLWMEARYEKLQWAEIPVWFRKCAWKVDANWCHLNLFDGNVHVTGLSDVNGQLFGKNSGMCAINLAYQRRPRRIFLFGFDMRASSKQHYFYNINQLIDDKKKITNRDIKINQSDSKYKEWLPAFVPISQQLNSAEIKVYNVCPDSAINVFEKIGWKDFLKCVTI